MAKKYTLSTAARNAACNAVTALLNSGHRRIYSGTRPATPATAITDQVLLAEIDFPADAFGDAVAGVATANTISPVTGESAAGTGTLATWFRDVDSADAVVADGNVATSDADLVLDNCNIASGQTVEITSLTHTQPAE